MKNTCGFLLSLLLSTSAFAQSGLTIDKLERAGITKEVTEVGFSTVLEGTVDNPNLAVYVTTFQPRLNGWRLFPAVTTRGSDGRYYWRAICQFGELGGKGVGDTHQVRAIAFDPSQIPISRSSKFPALDSPSVSKTNVIVVKRTK